MILPESTPAMEVDRKEYARSFLRLQNGIDQYSRTYRPHFAKLAKHYGLTNQEIANEYGISEAAVRGLIKRSA